MTAAKIIPFDFRGESVRAITINGDPWFVAADACTILGQTNTTKALQSLDEDERSNFKLGRQGEVNIISESGLYTLILRCRDAVKKGSKPHAFRKWVTAEVLPSIRKHGRYEDADGKMGTLLGQTIGTDGFHMLGAIIKGKVVSLPQAVQRRATAKIWSQTHAAFGVRSAADIPADQLDAARNFIAAYALEGEWLPKQDDAQADAVNDNVTPPIDQADLQQKCTKQCNDENHDDGVPFTGHTVELDFGEGYDGKGKVFARWDVIGELWLTDQDLERLLGYKIRKSILAMYLRRRREFLEGSVISYEERGEECAIFNPMAWNVIARLSNRPCAPLLAIAAVQHYVPPRMIEVERERYQRLARNAKENAEQFKRIAKAAGDLSSAVSDASEPAYIAALSADEPNLHSTKKITEKK